MQDVTPDLCDEHEDRIRILELQMKDYGGLTEFSGPIVTVKCFEDNSKVKELLATPGEGRVMVVDAGGSMRRACLGDMLAEQAVANGWAGIIMYGCIRDAAAISKLRLGVKALGTHPCKTEKKGVGDIDIPVQFGGVTFSPGDYVYADCNGVVVSNEALNARL